MNKFLNKYNSLPDQVRASMWFLICSVLQRGISTITTPIFTRLLNPTEYGNFNVFTSWLDIVAVIVTMKMYFGIYTQGLVKYDEKKDEFSSALQGLTLVLCASWTIIYLALHNFWNGLLDLTTSQMLAMLLMTWTTAVFSFWSAYQRVQYKYRTLVILTLAVSFIKPIVGIILVTHAADKVTARVWGIAAVEFLFFFGLFISQMRKGKVFYDLSIWKYALGFSIPLIPHYLAQTLLNGSDKIMIKRMIGADEAGLYGLAYSLSLLMTLVNTSLLQTVNPWIYQKIKAKETDRISGVAYPALMIIAFMNLILICFAPEILRIMAPSQYGGAIWVIPPVAMSVYFIFSYSLFADFEFYFEKTSFITTSTVIAAGLNIILNYIFIKLYGYYAAGYTTLVSYIVYSVMHFHFMKKICKEENIEEVYNTKILVGISAIFLFAGFAIQFTYRQPVIRYGILLLLLSVAVINRKKLKEYFDMIRNEKRKKV